MSSTKNGVKTRLARRKEEDIDKGGIRKTQLLNLDGREEILNNMHKIGIKVRSRVDKGKGDNKQKHIKRWSRDETHEVAE
jgi:hypothetical protein